MESADDGDPGPCSSFTVLSQVTIPTTSIIIKTVQAQEPYSYVDSTGRVIVGKSGDTKVEVLSGPLDGARNILWLERGWRSKRLAANFMKAFHYAQRVEQVIRMEKKVLSPEVIDRELLRRVT
jgi:hypothetical protein